MSPIRGLDGESSICSQSLSLKVYGEMPVTAMAGCDHVRPLFFERSKAISDTVLESSSMPVMYAPPAGSYATPGSPSPLPPLMFPKHVWFQCVPPSLDA